MPPPTSTQERRRTRRRALLAAACVAWLVAAAIWPRPGAAQTADVAVYRDGLATGWSDWSWCTRNLAQSATVHQGTQAVAVTYAAPWTGLYFHAATALPGAQYARIDFWVHGGTTGGQRLRLVVNNDTANAYALPALPATWTLVSVPLASLGAPDTLQDLVWQDATGATQPTFYIDDIVIAAGTPAPVPPPQAGPTLTVDLTADRAPISPLVYGMNFADEGLAAELDLPINRWGGNATTRYNWMLDVSNRASDWYFENIPNDTVVQSLPDGSAADQFVQANRARSTDTLLTVPLIGWTPRARATDCGFSVAKYGPQQSTDSWRPDCGNGVRPDGSMVTGNDPADTSLAIGPAFVTEWIAHLRARFGGADAGGVRYFNLDNEPELWNSTHRDVHPQPLGYDELLQRSVAYARAIKDAEPRALTLGPVGWGWTAYFYSAADMAAGGNWWTTRPDRRAHGDTPLVEWYLREMRAQGERDGRRLLDFLDLHYYPQAAGVSLQGAGGTSTQALRLRSTRSLWDPTYTDESWIDGTEGGPAVQLLPRMRAWVDAYYPGTRLAVTEYNWGALDHINGALAQADVLGIFGREGLDLATLWAPPTPAQPGAFAFRMFRNYDGAGHQFGDVRVRARSTDQDLVAIYAAERTADRILTIVMINKSNASRTVPLQVTGAPATAAARVFRYSGDDPSRIARLADATLSAGATVTLPERSITLLEIPLGAAAPETRVVSGAVREGGNAMPGVLVTLSGGCGSSMTTAGDGTYSLSAPRDATCVVTPMLTGRAFLPASRSVVLNDDVAGIDFTALAAGTAALSGVVTDVNGTGLPGVSISVSGPAVPAVTSTTGADGSYVVAGIAAGATITVAASRDGFTFAPSNQSFQSLQGNLTAAPFVAQSGTYTRYFAEGATGAHFDTSLALLNPTAGATVATLRFETPDGTHVERTLSIAARSRATIDPKDEPALAAAEFSTSVTSTQPLVIDRTMSWGAGSYGAHAEASIPAPAATWYLAEGATGAFHLFYLLQNPHDTPAQVRVRYLRPSGQALEKSYSLPPASRTNIWVNQEEFGASGLALAQGDVSAVIEVTQGLPIIVERAMYLDLPGQPFGAGHESAGVTAPSTQWFLAEGATGPYFDLFVLLANPSAQPAEIDATYLLPDGTTITKHYSVAANARFTVWVDHEDTRLADTAVSTRIRSSNGVPVIVERALWWPDPGWYEAHNSPGSTATGTT